MEQPVVDDDERLGRFNCHPEEDLTRLTTFLRSPGPSRVVILAGPEGIGRSYSLEAAIHRLRSEGQRWEIVDVNLDGHEPDHGSIEDFLEHTLRRRMPSVEERRALRRALLPLIEIAGKTYHAAAVVAVVLGLAKPAAEIARLLPRVIGKPLPQLPVRERLVFLLETLLDLLPDGTSTVLLLKRPHHLSDPLKRLLLQLNDRRPSLVLAFLAFPTDMADLLVPHPRLEPFRLDVSALNAAQVREIIARNFASEIVSSRLSAPLFQASKGYPSDLAARLNALVSLGCLFPDDRGGWQLCDQEDSRLVRVFSHPLFDPLDEILREAKPAVREEIERFLAAAVICGENVPADIVCLALGFDDETRDQVIDFVDRYLVAPERVPEADGAAHPVFPAFQDFEYNHPGFAQTAVYAFASPLFRQVLRSRLAIADWHSLALELLSVLPQGLPTNTRAAAAVHLSAVTFVEDEKSRAKHLEMLAWWVGVEECEELRVLLTDRLANRALDPEMLLSIIRTVRETWPPYRTYVLLEGYAAQPDGVPIDRLWEYHLAHGEVLRELGRHREAIFHAAKASRLGVAHGNPLGLAAGLALVAECSRLIGKTKSALHFAQLVVQIAEESGDTRTIGTAVNNLGLVLRDLDDHVGAKQAFERALAIQQQGPTPNELEISATIDNLGSVLFELEDYQLAKRAHERALEIRVRILGENHLFVATSAMGLAAALAELGEDHASMAMVERALAIRQVTLGPSHPEVIDCLCELGMALAYLEDYEAAKAKLEMALSILESGREVDYSAHQIAAVSMYLGAILVLARDREGARLAFERGLNILLRTVGSAHPDTISLQDSLASLR